MASGLAPRPSPSGSPHDPDHGGDGGEVLKGWSSLIGIVTAIVGNVLIAMALNVQRYAHIRLHKDRVRARHRARAALKRAQNGAGGGGYGTMGDEPNGPGSSGPSPGDERDGPGQTRETDPLSASFQSGVSNETEDDDDDDDEKVASTYLKSPYWWLGQVLITLGEMGNFLAYGFAPASIVSPLGVVALISNCIIAPAVFHEQFRQRDFWGVCIAVSGVVTVVLSASQEETKLNPHDVWDAITATEFEVYLGVTTALIIALMWASRIYGRRTILIDLGLVGLFGGYTALATKGVSSMLSSSLWRAFATPVTYVLIVILLGTAIMQIRYVNKALQRFDSTQVIPIQFVMFTLCVILGSAVLYRDFERMTPRQAGKFVGGCLLTFFGVFLITSGRQQIDDEEDLLSETDGVDETINLADQDGNRPECPTTHVPQSRRSSRLSRVSFAETIRPLLPKFDGDIPSFRFPGPNEPTPGREPATISSSSWQGSTDASSPYRETRTLSADSIMTTSALGSTPGLSAPTTPFRDSLIPPAWPTDRPDLASRQSHGTSKSASHHRSGPFISPSPLSSTVTTVVKDAFLRHSDKPLPHRSSLRRIRSSIRASLFFGDDDEQKDDTANSAGQGVMPASEDNLASGFEEPGGESHSDAGRRRTRSVSDTIGDFFRPKRKKRKSDDGEDGTGVEDAGPRDEPPAQQ